MPAEKIVSELVELILGSLSGMEGVDLCAMEQRALDLGRKVAELALAAMTGSVAEPSRVVCSCGKSAGCERIRRRTVVTLAGTQTLTRRLYHCQSCGEWTAPRDESLGIGRGNYSPGVIALASEVAAGFPFEATQDFLARRFGLDICYKQVQRLSERTGADLAQTEDLLFEEALLGATILPFEHPERLTVLADGVMIQADGAWQEMKVGVFQTAQARTTTATMGKVEAFGHRLWLEAARRGLELAQEVVFLADGAPWIWNLADEYFPGAVEIVDFYHASQHLWQVANAIHGEGSSKAKVWVKRNTTRLMEDKVVNVAASIRQWHPPDEDGKRVKQANLHYFGTNARRMLYRTFRQRGYDIGSGSVESACKQYGHGRLKQAGMRWTTPGAEAIANLRTAILNKRHPSILEAARKVA